MLWLTRGGRSGSLRGPVGSATVNQSNQLRALSLLSAVLMVAYAVVFTLLAAIRDAHGFSDGAIGLIAGSAFAAGFVAQLALAPLADRGHGGLLLRVGLAVAIAGMAWMVVAEALWEWLAARSLLGFGAGAVRPAVRRYVMVIDPARAGRSLGALAAWETAGFLVGPVLASLLVAEFPLGTPFACVALLIAAFTPLLWGATIPAAERPTANAMATLVRRASMQSALALGTAFYVAIGVFEAVWAIYMADRGASQMFIGVTMSLFTLPMIVVAPWAGGLAQRRNVLSVVTLTMSVAAACMLAYGGLDSIWWLLIPVAIHATVDAVSMPAVQLAVGYASGEGALAAGQGLYGATGMAVATVASLVSGAVYEYSGALGIWGAAAAIMAVCIGLAQWRGRGAPEFLR